MRKSTPRKKASPKKTRKKVPQKLVDHAPLADARRAEATMPAETAAPVVAQPVVSKPKRSAWPMTLLFIAVIFLLPFLVDYIAQIAGAFFGPQAVYYFAQRRWLVETAAYVPIYLFMLFYLKTTFNPLSFYGYQWNKQYLGWATYIGVGSGVIIYFMDRVGGIVAWDAASITVSAVLGYILGFVILPSLVEETLFRGVIQNFYQRRLDVTLTKYNFHIGILIASIFEVAFHLAQPVYYGVTIGGVRPAIIAHIPQIIYVFIFGAIGGYFYQRTKSLAVPILIHALGNLTEFVLILLFH